MGDTMDQLMSCRSRLSIATALLIGASAIPAWGEMYMAGQVGLTSPRSASQVDLAVDQTILPPISLSGLELKNSIVYGGKLGYYFDSVKSLGIETEAFTTTPHLKQQNVTVSALDGSPPVSQELSGAHFRVTTLAFNLVVRYPGGRFQPYAGAGPAIFFAQLKGAADSASSTKPGLNTQVGLRYLITPNLALFGEWKYNHVRFSFDTLAFGAGSSGVSFHYSAHHFVFGIGYHF
ncbi:MAG: porin family protein [Nitrospira sp.]